MDYHAQELSGKGWVLVKEPITPALLLAHLRGEVAVGVYSTSKADSTVRWVVWDLDHCQSSDVYSLLSVVPAPVLVEKTGGSGRHLWKFWATPQPAALARLYGLHMLRQAGLPSSTEVFPKQDYLEKGQYGNLVRVPWGRSGKTGAWSSQELGDWVFSPAPTVPTKALVMPQDGRAPTGYSYAPGGQQAWLSELLSGGNTVTERNNKLYRLHVWLKARDFPADFAADIVLMANSRLASPLDDEEIGKVLRRG